MYSLRFETLSSVARKAGLLAAVFLLSLFAYQTAFAADTLSSQTYIDADGDGTVDHAKLTFDENVIGCTYEAGDWTVNTAGSITLVITGIDTTDPETTGEGACDNSDGVVYLTVSADANETGATTAPVISYANAGTTGSLAGATTAELSAQASKTLADAAAPVLVSVSPSVSATGVGRNADLVLTYSEAMDTTFAEGTEFTVTPDPGSFSAAWTVGNTVVTLTTPPLLCNKTYAVDADNTDVDAAAGTPTNFANTGPVDGTWSFTTGTCSASGSTPSNVSIDYWGAVCSADDAHRFIVTGDNLDSYIVSDNDQFVGAEWESYSSSTINAELGSGADTAYLLFRSADGNMSNVYEVSLDNWDNECLTTGDDTQTDEPADDSGSSSAPVAGVHPGDIVRASDSSAVYYVTEDYGRRVFVNEAVFFTWFSSFSSVKTVSDSTLSALPLEGLMLPKAGVVLVKIQSSAKVYYLGSDGDAYSPVLREIADEATAKENFGSGWAAYVIDIEPTFFTRFGTGSGLYTNEHFDREMMKRRVDLH